jgi:hypothetical protein
MQRIAWTDERLEERFDGIDRRFDEVDRRFDGVESISVSESMKSRSMSPIASPE